MPAIDFDHRLGTGSSGNKKEAATRQNHCRIYYPSFTPLIRPQKDEEMAPAHAGRMLRDHS
jgi:hypothetical protein